MTPIPTGLLGATGRMGTLVAQLIRAHYAEHLDVAAAPSGQAPDLDAFATCDIVIDFSLPEGTARLTDWLVSNVDRPATVVSGTTGCGDDVRQRFLELGRTRKVMHATNFSAGVAAMTRLLRTAAPLLGSLGYTPVVTETHHRHKKDAPSGTALTLAGALRPVDPDTVQTHSIRAGEIVCRHDVTFFGDHDTLTISHDALDRGVFARGAIDVALWLHSLGDVRGSYTIDDYVSARLTAAADS